MKKYILITILILTMTLLQGCWDVSEIDKTQFPISITIDPNQKSSDSSTFIYSLQFPILDPNAPKKTNNLSTVAYSLENAINELNSRTRGTISLGMLRTVVFNEKIAKSGLSPHIDALWRNPLVAGSITLAITSSKANKLYNIDISSTEISGQYLDSLFQTTSTSALLPIKSLNNFFVNLKTKGVEPFLPIIKYGANDIKIIGAAIFNEDKMIGKIEKEELRALLLLREKFTQGKISFKVDNYIVSYFIRQVRSNIKPIYKDGEFLFDISINLTVDVIENTSPKRIIGNKTTLKNMQRHLATAIEKEIRILMNKLQKSRSDIIGIGRIVKAKHPNLFNPNEWNQDFRKASTKIKVKVNIVRLGIAV